MTGGCFIDVVLHSSTLPPISFRYVFYTIKSCVRLSDYIYFQILKNATGMPHLKIVNKRLNIILCSQGDTNNRSRSAVLPDHKLHESEA